ncbi:hypothetical protein IJ579_01810 [bacterium]|nr:hypothetical protein [bacterium]
MKTDKIDSSLYFQARLINKVRIGKLNPTKKYIYYNAHFVELKPDILEDFEAINEIPKIWKDNHFADNIAVLAEAKRNKPQSYQDLRLFALTSQEDHFEKMDPESVLGIAQICEIGGSQKAQIEYIETKPSIVNHESKEFKGIGHGMIKSIKQLYNRIVLIPENTKICL